MKTILALALLFTSNAFAQETLVFAEGTLKAEIAWIQGPRMPDVSHFTIEWKAATNDMRVNPPGAFTVTLWMPMHDHGSSPVTITKSGQEPGVFNVTDIYFNMPGGWDVKVNLKYSNGTEETRTIKVNIPTRRR